MAFSSIQLRGASAKRSSAKRAGGTGLGEPGGSPSSNYSTGKYLSISHCESWTLYSSHSLRLIST
jgi:hypothetical protein